MPFPFSKRLLAADGYIRTRFTKARLLKNQTPTHNQQESAVPKFELFMKEMFHVQDAHVLFEHILPRLEHENDGLIFTVDAAPYYMGVCPHIWKWKPMHLNTIDFNVRPLPIANATGDSLVEVWALYCSNGELFDFIVFEEASERANYAKWREEKKAECVLECNFDHELGRKMPERAQKLLSVINGLKARHGVDTDDFSDGEEQEKRPRSSAQGNGAFVSRIQEKRQKR
mmetsp:Transcript_43301/g.57296  ORF Transcript_43301/g.57296 Transcript_43301/m.57296 type:complete len:229 (+) Transcript_43301:526-1212(+)|eukprot:CAMPEP_0185587184 /NCGR_PEP_ID=MMETSP0434-20130131/47877_1 /TAXON_ID=626734 ORGANISM="Favella taraikaensis, Strain Fe Narragansett Bay" /NCGR_SAMPLE_ID=MMETSP0434 /ASSEMBLY_ACC=CAM_ASM_000379 /LENGTH=228 /DNA_ID=CAMNT_0028208881 /DNA_START=513 /DNA_END=1199 /DNA_ORIENTATION=-